MNNTPKEIFSSIPTFPEEDKLTRLGGAPRAEWDSALLNPAVSLDIAANPIFAMEKAVKRVEKDKVAREVASTIAKNPELLDQVYTYWAAIAETDPVRRGAINELRKLTADNLYEQGKESSIKLTPEQLAGLIADNAGSLYREENEHLYAGFLHRETDPKVIMNVFYELARVTLESDDDTKLRYALKIFCYDTDVLKPNGKTWPNRHFVLVRMIV